MKEREKLRKEGRDREKKVWGEEAGRRERERERDVREGKSKKEGWKEVLIPLALIRRSSTETSRASWVLQWSRIRLQCRRHRFDPWVRKRQCPCLENFMDRGAWPATGHGVTKSQTRLSN